MKQTIKRTYPLKINLSILFIIVSLSIWSLNGLAQDIWQPSNGPFGGSVYDITNTPDGTVYAGTLYGGLFKSTDKGVSWQPTGMGGAVWSLLAVSDSMIFAGSHSSSLYRTTDTGNTWEIKNNGLPGSSVISMVYSSDGYVFAATREGIYRTDDDGDNWVAVNTNLSDLNVNDLLITSGDVLYAGTQYDGLFRSTSNGDSWDQMTNGIPIASISGLAVDNDDNVYAGVGSNNGVYVSLDGGSSWSNIGLNSRSIRSLAVNSSGDLFAGTWQSGMYYSSDGGGTWESSILGFSPLNIETIHVDPLTDEIYVGCIWYYGGGIYYSADDGISWERRNEGLAGTRLWKMAVSPASGFVFAGDYYSGIYRSQDMGISWEILGNGMPELQSTFIRALAVHPSGAIFSGSSGGGLHRSMTDGENWERVHGEIGVYSFVGAVAVREDGAVFLGESDVDGGVFWSLNEGGTWEDITTGAIDSTAITCFAFDSLGYIYIGTGRDGVFRSTDNGQTWSSVGTDLSTYEIFDIAINSKGNVFVTVTGQGVFKTTDNSTWTQLGADVLGTTNRPIEINSKDHIFVGLQNLWVSKDDGNTWLDYDQGLNSSEINDLALDMGERLYAGTYHGVFSTFEPTTAVTMGFTVKMKYEDGFDPSSQTVVVRGPFNNWGVDGEWDLQSQEDEDLTYMGTFSVLNPADFLRNDSLDYKYVIPNDPGEDDDVWELFEGNRLAIWDGKNNLSLNSVWFSNQKEFTHMTTSGSTGEITDSRGVAWGDYDNDGDEDLVIAEPGGTSRNDLFENNGDNTFTKITTGPVATDLGDSRAATWGDFNNDGFLDLYITNLGSQNNFLYKYDNGSQVFVEMTGGPETSQGGSSVGAAWGDFNNDGYLDLFVANASGEENFLYLNEQDETFTAVTTGLVVTDANDSRGCSVADFNNDNLPDIFVANGSATPNRLYQNNGDGSFTPVSGSDIATDVHSSYGGSWGDYNNDGLLDLYVTNQEVEPNILYRNEGSGAFTKVAAVIIAPDSSESRGSAWMDYDKDGLLDLFVANVWPYRNVLYHQLGDGTFEKISIGPIVTDPNNDSRGAAWADYDNDGDPDLFVANDGGPNALYRNNSSGGNWLKVKLFGKTSNASGIGAKVLLFYENDDGGKVVQRRDIESQSGFLGQNSLLPVFGLGGSTTIDSVVVNWPSGVKNVAVGPQANTLILITEGDISQPLPPAPILNSPADTQTDVAVPPTLSWNVVSGVAKYEVHVAESILFTTLAVQDSNVASTVTSFTANTLTYNTTYYWRVRARNEVGWGPWSSVWQFTTAPLAGQPDKPTLIDPSDGEAGTPIPAPLSWTSTASGTYTVQVDSNNLFPDPVYNINQIPGRQVFVSDLEPNTQYYWRVRINVSGTESEWSDVWSFTTFNLTFQAQTTFHFPLRERRDEFSSADYLLRGLPGNADVHMSQIFGESAGEKWMAYWDNGGSSNYFVAVNNTGIFRFVTGKAFWLIHNGDITINQNIPQAPLNEYAQAEIIVHSGFNLITSPFAHAIDWDVVKEVNGITSDIPLWGYNRSSRSFESVTSLLPVEGFYFFNESSARTTLLVPYTNTAPAAVTGINKPVANSELLWQINLSLQAGESVDNSTRLGVANDALPGIDDHDYRKPRAFADIANIFFNREEWDDEFSIFASDIRPEIEDVEIWDFQVYVPVETDSKLSFSRLADIPEEYDVYLIDKTRYTYVDLRQEVIYEFVSTPSLSDFEIVVGNTDNVMERISSVIPTEFALGQNYPNPFNPTTTIPLVLPEKSDIILTIYNLLGQEIKSVFQGTLNTGRHYFTWDARNSANQQMPSGIYIYQMQTSKGLRLTGKMVLIK